MKLHQEHSCSLSEQCRQVVGRLFSFCFCCSRTHKKAANICRLSCEWCWGSSTNSMEVMKSMSKQDILWAESKSLKVLKHETHATSTDRTKPPSQNTHTASKKPHKNPFQTYNTKSNLNHSDASKSEDEFEEKKVINFGFQQVVSSSNKKLPLDLSTEAFLAHDSTHPPPLFISSPKILFPYSRSFTPNTTQTEVNSSLSPHSFILQLPLRCNVDQINTTSSQLSCSQAEPFSIPCTLPSHETIHAREENIAKNNSHFDKNFKMKSSSQTVDAEGVRRSSTHNVTRDMTQTRDTLSFHLPHGIKYPSNIEATNQSSSRKSICTLEPSEMASGGIGCVVRLDKGGFVAGEDMSVVVEVCNNSTSNIHTSFVSLQQVSCGVL